MKPLVPDNTARGRVRSSTTPFNRRASFFLILATVLFVLLPYDLLPNAFPAVFGPLGRLLNLDYAHVARFTAFMLIAAALGAGYPRHRGSVVLLLIVVAAALELAQQIVPGRTSRLPDFIAKAAGTLVGVGVSIAVGVRKRQRDRLRQ